MTCQPGRLVGSVIENDVGQGEDAVLIPQPLHEGLHVLHGGRPLGGGEHGVQAQLTRQRVRRVRSTQRLKKKRPSLLCSLSHLDLVFGISHILVLIRTNGSGSGFCFF
jgi:hypothetical protein